MYTRDIKDLEGTDRDVHFAHKGFRSIRVLLEKDGMGFSLHKTILPKGLKEVWHYKKHLEACYCISGHATVTDLATDKTFDIKPDTTYILDNNDKHEFVALEDTVLISVFNPPVKGTEIHKSDGSYE